MKGLGLNKLETEFNLSKENLHDFVIQRVQPLDYVVALVDVHNVAEHGRQEHCEGRDYWHGENGKLAKNLNHIQYETYPIFCRSSYIRSFS